jgi:L-2-hydroxyglutarate oxidase
MSVNNVDFLVVGGGIVGLATAHRLSQQFSDAKILVLEKESEVAQHQSGRNSGVLHSGIYYKPGSLKSVTCREGKLAMEGFCQEHGIRYEICGKIIVATDDAERQRLHQIYERGQASGVACRVIDTYEMQQIEPHAAGVAAIHVLSSGIVDYPAVCERLKQILQARGHGVGLQQKVVRIDCLPDCVHLETASGHQYRAGFLISCGGLYSDQLARMSGLNLPAQIVPFRGEYYALRPERSHLCKHLIYPVPDPDFPFLGVHFTRMVDGSVECGPNAVLALAREGYSWSHIRLAELLQSLAYRGLRHVAARHWQAGLGEMKRSLFKSAFVKALQRLIPELQAADLIPCRSGVRAQAIAPDGTMIDDFLWAGHTRSLHVCNAPSPAATASFEIAKRIVEQAQRQITSHSPPPQNPA